jgi:hypothetical protein
MYNYGAGRVGNQAFLIPILSRSFCVHKCDDGRYDPVAGLLRCHVLVQAVPGDQQSS